MRANLFLKPLLCLVNPHSFDCSALGLMRLETVIRGWHFFMGTNVFITLRAFRNAGFSTIHYLAVQNSPTLAFSFFSIFTSI